MRMVPLCSPREKDEPRAQARERGIQIRQSALHSAQLAGATHRLEGARRGRHDPRSQAPRGAAKRMSARAQTVGVAFSHRGGDLGHPGFEVLESRWIARGSVAVWRRSGSSRIILWMVARMFDAEASSASYIAARMPRYWNVSVTAVNVANNPMKVKSILIESDVRRVVTRGSLSCR